MHSNIPFFVVGAGAGPRCFRWVCVACLALAVLAPGARADGTFEWAVAMGGTGSPECQDVAVDAAGNVYTTGFFSGTVDFGPYQLVSVGYFYIFLAKQAPDGAFLWARSMGGSGTSRGHGVAVDSAGKVYTTGGFNGTVDFDPGSGIFNLTSAGSSAIFVSKLDTNGNFLWARSMGGTGSGQGQGIAVDSAGNVYATGWFSGMVDFGPIQLAAPDNGALFVSKLNTNGDVVWVRSMVSTHNVRSRDIAVDSAGNVYTTGFFNGTADFDPGSGSFTLTSAGSADTFVSKLDTNGDFVWTRALSGTVSNFGYGIAVDGAANVYTTGRFISTVDFDPGPGTFNLTSAGEFGFNDIFVSKLDSNGDFIWARSMGGPDHDESWSIGVDGTGNVYTTGFFNGTADFDPGPGTFNLTSAGNKDIFVSKLDTNGGFVWARSMGGTERDQGTAIAVDQVGNVHVAGAFFGAADFDPGPSAFNLAPAGSFDMFVVKLSGLPDTTPPAEMPAAAPALAALALLGAAVLLFRVRPRRREA